MPGVYLAAILGSAAGIAILDWRWRLVFARGPVRAAASILIGTAFFILWDLVGIATGVFVKGDSPLLVGVDLAPHLPVEEPCFLAFLCYLALVVHAGVVRMRRARA